jgi:hypothetical protein
MPGKPFEAYIISISLKVKCKLVEKPGGITIQLLAALRYIIPWWSVLWSRNFLFPLRLRLRLRLSTSFRSGSGSGDGSGSDISFVSTFFHRFHVKKWIFNVFLWKNINIIHMLDSIQYEFWFLFATQADPEPEPKLRHSGSGSSQKVRLLAAPAPQHWWWWRFASSPYLHSNLKISPSLLGE